MTRLGKVGFHFEIPREERKALLTALRDKLRAEYIEDVVRYLAAGTPFASGPGIETDILDNDDAVIGPITLRTDGTWCWPESLIHYVRRYRIGLPEEFLDHMKRNHWKCLPVTATDQLSVIGQIPLG